MRLRAARSCRVRIPGASLVLDFRADDEISTEISCKYTRTSFTRMLPGTSLRLDRWYTDADDLFALALLRRARAAPRLT